MKAINDIIEDAQKSAMDKVSYEEFEEIAVWCREQYGELLNLNRQIYSGKKVEMDMYLFLLQKANNTYKFLLDVAKLKQQDAFEFSLWYPFENREQYVMSCKLVKEHLPEDTYLMIRDMI